MPRNLLIHEKRIGCRVTPGTAFLSSNSFVSLAIASVSQMGVRALKHPTTWSRATEAKVGSLVGAKRVAETLGLQTPAL